MKQIKHSHVIFYYSNIIDYLRYIFAISSFFFGFVTDKWLYFIVLYILSIISDAFDGVIARKFNQESRFGCCLDMVCDRSQVSMMYLVLARVHPKFEMVLIIFFLLDYGSHFL